jgi:hypothetical protein
MLPHVSIRHLWAQCCHTHIIPHVKAPPSLSPFPSGPSISQRAAPTKAFYRVFCRSEQDPDILVFGIATVPGHADDPIWKVRSPGVLRNKVSVRSAQS